MWKKLITVAVRVVVNQLIVDALSYDKGTALDRLNGALTAVAKNKKLDEKAKYFKTKFQSDEKWLVLSSLTAMTLIITDWLMSHKPKNSALSLEGEPKISQTYEICANLLVHSYKIPDFSASNMSAVVDKWVDSWAKLMIKGNNPTSLDTITESIRNLSQAPSFAAICQERRTLLEEQYNAAANKLSQQIYELVYLPDQQRPGLDVLQLLKMLVNQTTTLHFNQIESWIVEEMPNINSYVPFVMFKAYDELANQASYLIESSEHVRVNKGILHYGLPFLTERGTPARVGNQELPQCQALVNYSLLSNYERAKGSATSGTPIVDEAKGMKSTKSTKS